MHTNFIVVVRSYLEVSSSSVNDTDIANNVKSKLFQLEGCVRSHRIHKSM